MKNSTGCFLFFLLLLLLPGAIQAEDAAVPAVAQTVDEDIANEDFDEDFDDDFVDEDMEDVVVSDPIEPFNRAVFWFNDKFYFYLLKPVARAYRIVPKPARVSVSNFFSNVTTPVRFVNSTLQFKFKDAGTELGRFVINSTVGIGGLFDPAKKYVGLRKKEEDFGQTLGRYGVGPGFYLVLPIFGPSNLRDTVGRVPDYFLNPINYIDDTLVQIGVRTFDTVNETSLDKDTYESIKEESLDPYLFIRDAYAQNREGKIRK